MVARLAAFAAALALAGCADQPRPDRFAGGPPHDRRGPPPGGTGPPGMGRARLFISPMGEPFRGEGGGIAPAAAWFAAADADHDGKLTRAEFSADAMRFFATLDVDRNGEIGPSEIDHYEQVVAPEIVIGGEGGFGGGERPGGGRGRHGGRGGAPGGGGGGGGGPPGGGGGPPGGGGGGRGRGGSFGGGALGGPGAGEPLQGAGRFGYLAAPEPVIAADADLNRAVTRAEFEAAAQRRFALLDRDGNGVLTEAELPRLGGGRPRSAP